MDPFAASQRKLELDNVAKAKGRGGEGGGRGVRPAAGGYPPRPPNNLTETISERRWRPTSVAPFLRGRTPAPPVEPDKSEKRGKSGRFFQSNARPNDPGYSGVGVVFDPGMPMVLSGLWMLMLGTFGVFILRPLLTRKHRGVK